MTRNALFVLLLLLLFVLPLIVLVLYSVSEAWRYPHLVPQRLSARAWEFVKDQWRPIVGSLASSLLYSALTVLLTFAFCVLPAGVFARESFPHKTILEAVLLAPALVPSITFTMGIHYLFILVRLTDTLPGVVLVLSLFSYPYMLRALTAGFQAYGEEYDVCAENLGAGQWMRLVRIDLPLLLPAIVSGGTVVFLVSFSEYFLVFVIGGGAVASYTGYLFPYLRSSDRPLASILTLLFLCLPILLFAVIDGTVNRIYRKRGMI